MNQLVQVIARNAPATQLLVRHIKIQGTDATACSLDRVHRLQIAVALGMGTKAAVIQMDVITTQEAQTVMKLALGLILQAAPDPISPAVQEIFAQGPTIMEFAAASMVLHVPGVQTVLGLLAEAPLVTRKRVALIQPDAHLLCPHTAHMELHFTGFTRFLMLGQPRP